MSPWKVISATLVIFCSGLVVGALIDRKAFHTAPGPVSPRILATNNVPSLWHVQQKEFLRRIDHELNLTEGQREKIQKILKESQERTKEIREKIAPEMKGEIKKVHEQIHGELTPEQQEKFEEAMKPKPPRRPEDAGEERRKLPKEGPRRPRTNSPPGNVAPANP